MTGIPAGAGTPRPCDGVPAQTSPPPHPDNPLPAAEGTRSPAGGALAADDASPAGTSGLSGEQWRKAARAAQSRHNAATRRQAGRYVPRAARSAGEQYVPGRNRRPPPGAA